MVFSSLIFLYGFLPLCLALYFLIENRTWKNTVLILSSLIFYAWGEPVWVALLILSSVVDYLNALWIEKFRGTAWAKLGVIFSLIFNLGVLAAFKYSGFIVQNLNAVLGLGLPVPAYDLPIGISFYTFQTISYVIDVYRGEVSAQRSLPKFLLYVSLFHQLVAGPIVRYKDVERDINHRQFSWDDVAYGIRRFAYGLIKKVLLANTAGAGAKLFLESGDPGSMAGAWWGIFLFALQIFFDFSGYSDMAIGMGRMFGFHYKENFNYPYIARSATDFWRRWHMSLGSFFRDYLYIPLGGNRKRVVFNLFLVWFLTGLWHGASWNFILWGLFYGVLIFFERILAGGKDREAPRWIAHPYLILITLVGWTLFYFENLGQGWTHLLRMFGQTTLPLVHPGVEIHVLANLGIILLAVAACLPWAPGLRTRLGARWPGLIQVWDQGLGILVAAGLVGLATVLLVGSSYNPFLYFRF